MMSVLPNGGRVLCASKRHESAALDDVSATEWRETDLAERERIAAAALDDVSATEWRVKLAQAISASDTLHSMMSVLPNGGKGSYIDTYGV